MANAAKVARRERALERRRNDYRSWESAYISVSESGKGDPAKYLQKMKVADQDIRNLEAKLGLEVSNNFKKDWGKK